MTDYKYLELRRDGAVLVVSIHNPPKNFLNQPVMRELLAMADEAVGDPTVRVLIITGGVPGIFITHYDVGELVEHVLPIPELSIAVSLLWRKS